MSRSPISSFPLRLGLAVAALVILAAWGGGDTASAKTRTCADQVVGDWFDDGRVGKLYPLECYRQAIASLPPDVLDYSNAKEEIGRALAFAKQGKQDPGGKDPTPPTTPTGAGTTPTRTTPTGTDATETTPTGTDATKTTPTGTDATETTLTPTVTQTAGTSEPSSVPIPLLVLGGLAVLLLAAGSAGYLRRRTGGDEDGDGSPPASA